METIKVELKVDGLGVDVDRKEFGMALKTWRLRRGVSQEEAGKMLGVSRYTIIRVEKADDISWQTAYKVFARFAEQLRKEGAQP